MSYNRNKYKIILFKNGERLKSFFSSNNKKSILTKYNKLIGEKKPKFVIEFLSRKKVRFELGIVTTEGNGDTIFVKDSVGRTKQVSMGDSTYNIIKLLPYWKQEFIYSHQDKNKISFMELMDNHIQNTDFKQ